MKNDYNKLFEKQIAALSDKKKLLLHCCCAPCASACLMRLKDFFEITVLFYNPNIEDEEYLKRKNELSRFIKETGWAKEILDCDRDKEKFYERAKGLENALEGSERCEKCFRLRLEKTARIAESEGFDFFTTTLTISPLKNAELINTIGKSLESENALWLYSDFKKKNGYLNSLRLSEQYSLYRQNYCGCVYSIRDKD